METKAAVRLGRGRLALLPGVAMPASAAELAEIEELKAMIHGTPERPTSVPMGAVSRFAVGEFNRERAEAARKEKEERDALKADLAAQRAEYAARIKKEAEERKENEKRVKAAAAAARAEAAAGVRQKEAKWKAQAEKRRQTEWEIAQKRVQDENEAWKRMNANEAAQDKVEREEGTKERKRIEAAFKQEREENLAENREKVKKVKAETDQAIVEEALAWAAQKREAAAEARRKQRLELIEARKANKEGFVEGAKGIKSGVNAMKENARAVQGEVLKKKKEHASKERDNDYLVQQAKIRTLASKKQQHQAVYGKKYAPQEKADSWKGASTLRRGAKVPGGGGSPPK